MRIDLKTRGRLGRARSMGFSLVELMIVVVIIGVLSAVAMVGYRRWIARARVTETVGMLGEMNSKEQTYKMEFGAYLPLRADGNLAQPSPDEGVGAFFPVSPGLSTFDSSRTSNDISNPALWPGSWRGIALNPRDTGLYCTYLTNAGGAGQAIPAGNTYGLGLVGLNTAAPWFYSLAVCNLDGPATYPAGESVFGLSSTSPTLKRWNDGL
jgi:prepilin-type N-terminal cleavage/methylation domain-containing protein